MPNVSLTPELDRFAEDCVRSGRYASVSEVHRAAMRLLQEMEAHRTAFTASLDTAIAEGRAQGFATIEDVTADMDAELDAAARRQPG